MTLPADRLKWLKSHRTSTCPECGGDVSATTMKGTFWCAVCCRVWAMTRDILSLRMSWSHEPSE